MSTPATPVTYWVEFPDPARVDDAVIYRCDLTWLTSRWRCLFGRGCPGIVAHRPDDGCCTYGAHFTDAGDRDRVAAAASQLSEGNWQYLPADWDSSCDSALAWLSVEPTSDERSRTGQGADRVVVGHEVIQRDEASELFQAEQPGDCDGEESLGQFGQTALVDGACIFLNRPGFPAGAGCALHQLALRTGQSVVATKPEVCWQLPIRRSYEESIAPDGVSRQVVRIGEFDRAAWGPGGHDLDWYCTRDPLAHSATEPLYRSARAELVALMGEPAYQRLAVLAAAFASGCAAQWSVVAGPGFSDLAKPKQATPDAQT